MTDFKRLVYKTLLLYRRGRGRGGEGSHKQLQNLNFMAQSSENKK